MAVPASAPQTTADEQVAAAIGAWVASLWKAGDGAPGTLHEQLMDLVERTLAEEVIQRTAGNRTADESRMLEEIQHQLRLMFMDEQAAGRASAVPTP